MLIILLIFHLQLQFDENPDAVSDFKTKELITILSFLNSTKKKIAKDDGRK